MLLVTNNLKIGDNVYEDASVYIGSSISNFEVGDTFSLNTFPKLLEFEISKRLASNSLMISGNQIINLNEYLVVVVEIECFIENLNIYYGQDYSINYLAVKIGVREIVESIGVGNIISHIDDPLQATRNYYSVILD